MKEITIKADKEYIGDAFDFIEGELAAVEGVSRKDVLQLHMVVDEIFSNIASYAYGEEGGEVKVGFAHDEENASVSITFIDEGIPYDPSGQEAPDMTASLNERKAGGLGIFMVRNTVDDLRYERRDGKNVLTIVKKTAKGTDSEGK